MSNAKKESLPEGMSKLSARSQHLLSNAHEAVQDIFSAATDLPTFLGSAGDLGLEDRKLLVEQALLLFENNYVHLPLKEAMHGVDPVQQLRLIKHRLEDATEETMGSEYEFHRQMLEVFNTVRDLHTNYLLPAPFAVHMAFLPFDVEEFIDPDGERHYIASHFISGFSHSHFEPGVEIKMWNGVPIGRAINVIANRLAGSNMAARHVRGIDGLTFRRLRTTLPPDEVWVDIGYIDLDGKEREMRQDWLVSPTLPDVAPDSGDAISASNAFLGNDLQTELVNQTKVMLFAPHVLTKEVEAASELSTQPVTAGESVTTTMPEMFRCESIDTPSGVFGYIRIFTFNLKVLPNPAMRKPEIFIEEFIRLMSLLPQNGLVLDVRGNPGGHIHASEGLLQLLTPNKIEPEPTQFINTPLNLRICERHEMNPTNQIDLGPWVGSIRRSVETGAVYSRSFPITPVEFANRWGQRYHGPVVLITDARCYSATDIFAAGFKDHNIGTILGIDDNTGAGGANVWDYGLLQDLLTFPQPADPNSPFKNLPNGAGMRVSVRRTLRVGAQSGTPVEDLGVRPHELYNMTKNDLLKSNVDLKERAGKILASAPVRQLSVSAQHAGNTIEIETDTKGLTRLDFYVNGRPLATHDVTDGAHSHSVKAPPNATRLELAGFDAGEFVAARKLEL